MGGGGRTNWRTHRIGLLLTLGLARCGSLLQARRVGRAVHSPGRSLFSTVCIVACGCTSAPCTRDRGRRPVVKHRGARTHTPMRARTHTKAHTHRRVRTLMLRRTRTRRQRRASPAHAGALQARGLVPSARGTRRESQARPGDVGKNVCQRRIRHRMSAGLCARVGGVRRVCVRVRGVSARCGSNGVLHVPTELSVL